MDLLAIIAHHGYAVTAAVLFFACCGLPLPLSVVLLVAGAAAHGGSLNLGLVIVIAFASAMCGDTLMYLGGRYCLYRWHADNPVTFRKSIKYTIEHGHANNRADNFYSVAYWYQTEPFTDFPELPPVDDRIPVPKES